MNLSLSAAGVSLGVIVAALAFGGVAAIQHLAAAFCVAAGVLFAIPGVHPIWGFAAFFVGNIGWIYFAAQHRHLGLLWQHIVLLVLALGGVWNWWLGPLVLG
jgi:hypothetical protein